jgi:hypothetical protein
MDRHALACATDKELFEGIDQKKLVIVRYGTGYGNRGRQQHESPVPVNGMEQAMSCWSRVTGSTSGTAVGVVYICEHLTTFSCHSCKERTEAVMKST